MSEQAPPAIRVVHVGPSVTGEGGIATAIENFMLKQAGDPEVRATTIPTWYGPKRNFAANLLLSALSFVRVALAAFSRPRPILHIHMSSRGSVIRKGALIRLARLLGLRCVLHMQGSQMHVTYEHWGTRGKKWFRGTMNRSGAVLTIADCWKDYFGPLTDSPVTTIPNGIDLPAPVERSQKSPGDPVRVVYVARLVKYKGLFDLLEAYAVLLREGLPVHLTLIGNTFVEDVRKWVNEHDLGGRVDVPGWVSEEAKAKALAGADIFALPSRFEGQGIAFLEAMSYNLPCIGGRTGGIPEVLGEGSAGLLVEPQDVDGLAEALRRLVGDPALRLRLGNAGRERLERVYTLDVSCARVKEVYRQLAR